MRWASLGLANRATVVSLAGAALAEIVGVLLLAQFNLIAVVFTLALVGMAALASTGRWVALALSTFVSVGLTVAAVTGTADRLGEAGEPGQLAGALIFSGFVLVASVGGVAATVDAYRNRSSGSQESLISTGE